MLKLFKFASLLLLSISAQASNLYYSGFIFNTEVLNDDYKDSKWMLAGNATYNTKLFSLSGQVANKERLSPIRRLHLDIPLPLDLNFRVGRFSRVMGFYNDVSDSPSTSGMGILPQAPYNDNFLTASFATMDGIQLNYLHTSNFFITYIEASYGKVEIADQKFVQENLFNYHATNIEFGAENDSYSLFTKLESGPVSILFEYSQYNMKWDIIGQPQNIKDFYAQQFALSEPKPNGSIKRLGLKLWQLSNTELSGEYYKLEASNNDNSSGFYILGETFLKDFYVFYGYSEANTSSGNGSSDRFFGIGRDFENAFLVLEYHNVHGKAWIDSNVDKVDSAVLTVGYRF